MDRKTREEMFQLTVLARERGLTRAARWIMRELASVERKARRPRPQMVRARLPGGRGSFWVEKRRIEEGKG